MVRNRLFIPGPTEVRPEILGAQTRFMIGHRSPEFTDMFGRIQVKIRQVFYTHNPVFILASSGTGLQEAAIRNCSQIKVLNCVNGAFSERWHRVTKANERVCETLEVEWGEPILPDRVVDRLRGSRFDAVTIVHNETSTGVTSPIREIARAIREMPGGDEIMILVDSVSGLGGARVEVDSWDLDVVLTASQKAFALPPGLGFCSVSNRALEKARSVSGRGYYFDFIELDNYLARDQTPNTPPISLLYALDKQLDDILAEGMEQRLNRHLRLRDRTISWARGQGLSLFATPGFESPTVSCIMSGATVVVSELLAFLRAHNMIVSDGYGPLKGKSFRIAHMGDLSLANINELLEIVDSFLMSPNGHGLK